MLYFSRVSDLISTRRGFPGSFWLEVTFLSKEDTRSKWESSKIHNILYKHPKLLSNILRSNLYESKTSLCNYVALLSKEGNTEPLIRRLMVWVNYVINFIDNRSKVYPNPEFNTEHDFWFMCIECGSKLLTDSNNWHIAWCSYSKKYK